MSLFFEIGTSYRFVLPKLHIYRIISARFYKTKHGIGLCFVLIIKKKVWIILPFNLQLAGGETRRVVSYLPSLGAAVNHFRTFSSYDERYPKQTVEIKFGKCCTVPLWFVPYWTSTSIVHLHRCLQKDFFLYMTPKNI